MTLPTIIIVLFFLAYYRPFRPITAFTISPHSSPLFFFTILTSSILRCSMTRSFHRCLGLRLSLLLLGIHFVTARICWPSALHTCPTHLIAWLLRMATILESLNRVATSLFELNSYPSSSFLFGPNILRNNFLSKIINVFLSGLVNTHRIQSV